MAQRAFKFGSLQQLIGLDGSGEVRRLAFAARNAAEARAWQRKLRRKVVACLGRPAASACDLDPVVTSTQETPEFVRRHVVIRAEPDADVPLYVLVPKRAEPPYRPVIAVHGHGTWGHHTVAGVFDAANPAQVAHVQSLNYDYGAQLARAGFSVFVPCLRGHGDRMEPAMLEQQARDPANQWLSSCNDIAKALLLIDRSLVGARVFDIGRVIDYIETQPEPNTGRIGLLGFSSGGTVATFAAATDRRIAAAVVASSLCSLREIIHTRPRCLCDYAPGLFRWAEMSDVAGLIAPRPLLVLSGTEDPISPIEAVRAACREIRRAYTILDAENSLQTDFFDGGHRYEGRKVVPFFEKCL